MGTDSSLTQYLCMTVTPSAVSMGWQQSLSGFWRVTCSWAHTKPLLPTTTCYMKRSPLKLDAARWVGFASFRPWKIKASFFFFFPQWKQIFCNLVAQTKINLWMFIPGSMLTTGHKIVLEHMRLTSPYLLLIKFIKVFSRKVFYLLVSSIQVTINNKLYE